MLQILDSDSFIIDQKVSYFRESKGYQIYNIDGQHIGSVIQNKSLIQKILKFTDISALVPFSLEIRDNNGNILAVISRGWTFFTSTIKIENIGGAELGYVKQKWQFLKFKFIVIDNNQRNVATLSSDIRANQFIVKDSNNQMACLITKKWKGVIKEAFSNSNKYSIIFEKSFDNINNKLLILSAAITIDLVLKKMK